MQSLLQDYNKIIAKRIRPILSRTLSEEQFGFLKGRQIIDAIGTAQECLHSIREKKLQALILKIDLKKSYDLSVGIFSDWFYSNVALACRRQNGLWGVLHP
jgi:hypothetical protein